MRRKIVGVCVVSSMMTACLPYTVGSTARTVPAGQSTRTASAYFIPNAVGLDGESATAMRGMDAEVRFGIDEKSDFGIRVPSWSGAVVTYKRRLAGDESGDGSALAVMVGGGLVNLAEHAEGELTLVASGREDRRVTAYGGVRAMVVAPLSSTAVTDDPTAGGFLGMRLRFASLDVIPELGVYYDRSALDLRSTNVILVPAISFSPRGARAR